MIVLYKIISDKLSALKWLEDFKGCRGPTSNRGAVESQGLSSLSTMTLVDTSWIQMKKRNNWKKAGSLVTVCRRAPLPWRLIELWWEWKRNFYCIKPLRFQDLSITEASTAYHTYINYWTLSEILKVVIFSTYICWSYSLLGFPGGSVVKTHLPM